MIFPTLKGQRVGYVNYNILALEWHKEHPLPPGSPNPFLNTVVHGELVYDFHRRAGLDYSYGGWLEDRSTILAGTYLEQEQIFMHLGVDLNPPEGTPVASDNEGEIVHVDDDYPEDGGWGPRVLIKLRSVPIVLIYAHLDPTLLCKVGDVLKPGDIFAKIGPSSHNGGWFPHLHVQSLTPEAYDMFKKDPRSIDGYAKISDIERVSKLFPDPIRYIRFK